MTEQTAQTNGNLDQIEASLMNVAREMNSKLPPRNHNEGSPRFVALADKLYDAAIEAARQQVTRAENLLREVELEAEQVRDKAKARWEQIQTLERDLEDMSSEMLQSFSRYNGGKK